MYNVLVYYPDGAPVSTRVSYYHSNRRSPLQHPEKKTDEREQSVQINTSGNNPQAFLKFCYLGASFNTTLGHALFQESHL